ncbi:MAG: UDP-N-acetylglucosamine 4,6-dehydratase (inverting) [Candidatus Margulisiibacteriota bacterium]
MKKHLFNGKTILVTGGTGSFGKKMIRIVLDEYGPGQMIVYSRDEMKQFMMQLEFEGYDNLRFVIGDIRDKERLKEAMRGVDYVVHAAALKIVPSLEHNPSEAVKTNIIGAMNIIECALDQKVQKVIALSTDKACNPVNLYGATKLCSDKLFIAANSHTSSGATSFAAVRYGNVVGSRGSVIPFFLEKKKEGVIPITDERMTRFFITLEQGVRFVLKNFERMLGGEVFVPKIPSMSIIDLAKAVAPDCKIKIIGIRPGEKLHEIMISADDARHTIELDDCFVIKPEFSWWDKASHQQANPVADEFSYSSNTNKEWLTIPQLHKLIEE